MAREKRSTSGVRTSADGEFDQFLIGWLDAMWVLWSEGHTIVSCPTDVSREMVRRGWLRPLSPKSQSRARHGQITPLGARMVIQANDRHGIHRNYEEEREES